VAVVPRVTAARAAQLSGVCPEENEARADGYSGLRQDVRFYLTPTDELRRAATREQFNTKLQYKKKRSVPPAVAGGS